MVCRTHATQNVLREKLVEENTIQIEQLYSQVINFFALKGHCREECNSGLLLLRFLFAFHYVDILLGKPNYSAFRSTYIKMEQISERYRV